MANVLDPMDLKQIFSLHRDGLSNRHKMKEGIFENLMKRMLERPPYPYKKFYLSNA